jgi:hypothetical protein
MFAQKRNQLYETSLIVNSIDLHDPDKAGIQLYASAMETKRKIGFVTVLVQDFLKFMDNYLKGKLELK